MDIEYWPVEKPIDYPKNARKWTDTALETVGNSIVAFGFRQPLVVDAAGVICIGHLRRAAARHKGIDTVPVHVARDLSAEQIRLLRLADNRTHEAAAWDDALLKVELGELRGLGIDLSASGFPSLQLDQILNPAPDGWRENWQDMPDFSNPNAEAFASIIVHFRNDEDRREFLGKLGEKPERVKSIWYPHMEYLQQSVRSAGPVTVPAGRYPVYVISKGRADNPLTINALEKLGLPFHVVIEPQEQERYAAAVNPDWLLILPFSNLGQGSIPARNWVWEHAAAAGAERHWILDDNLDGFYRLNNNLKTKVVEENPFTALDDFVDRYRNIAIAGLNYEFFASRRAEQPPYRLNTRIYSCILIRNDIPYRWRGRYNEDTDLSIRALKDGWCTVLWNLFLAKKMPTMTMKGGNTDELYAGDGRLKMAESLREQHPDIVTITEKWGRPQHHVNYKVFRKNKLVLKDAPASAEPFPSHKGN